MKLCPKCGARLFFEEDVCPACREQVTPQATINKRKRFIVLSNIFAVISFAYIVTLFTCGFSVAEYGLLAVLLLSVGLVCCCMILVFGIPCRNTAAVIFGAALAFFVLMLFIMSIFYMCTTAQI